MKFYPHYPDAWLAGTTELSFEQCGAYIKLINLLYSRDGMVPDQDAVVARMLQCDPRLWRRLKNELMAAGKVRVTTDGRLTANGVDQTRLLAQVRSTSARHQANVRWENYRKAKQNNDPLMQGCNTSIINKDIYSSTSVEAEGVPAAVDKVAEQTTEKAESQLKASTELEALIRRKQQFDKDWR